MFEWLIGCLVVAILVLWLLAYLELFDVLEIIGALLKLALGLVVGLIAVIVHVFTRRKPEGKP